MVPFLHVTTHIEGHPYDELLREKGGTGFPTLMFLDAFGRTILKHDGARSVRGFEGSLDQVHAFLTLMQRAEAGDADAATTVLLRQLELEWFDYEEALQRYEALEKVSAREKDAFERLLIDTEVRSLAEAAGSDPAKRRAAGERFYEMWKEKRVPDSSGRLYVFWSLIADYAEGAKDKKLFQSVVRASKNSIGKHRRYSGFQEDLERRLANFPK